MKPTRRALLATAGSLGAATLAGCLGDFGSDDTISESATGGRPTDDPTPVLVEANIGPADRSIGCSDPGTPQLSPGPPLSDQRLTLVDCPERLRDDITSGGVGQDGIPSIDDPKFVDVSEAESMLSADDPVFGVVRDGVAKVYPQHVLVWHEIVNDEIAGDPVAVTYCPLTGTAQGFERGDVEFGVSGQLLNSNLIMYDRETESYWPQMLATAITGPATGGTLQEFPVHWTTWEHWSDAHPDSQVLSEDTGFARNYDRDPYGSYAPRTGHYGNDSFVFSPYVDDAQERLHPKAIVLGARTETGALAVEKTALREHGVLQAPVDGGEHVAVYDQTLDTGYIYDNREGHTVDYDGGTAVVDGEQFAPDDLPLDPVLRYDSMWSFWYGYYPHTTLVRRDTAEIGEEAEQ